MKYITKPAILALLVLFLYACGKDHQVPHNVLSKAKMSAILVDMSLADAYSYEMQVENMQSLFTDSIRQEKVKVFYKQILDLHKVSVAEFMSSYRYYESHPAKLKEVLQLVQANMAARKKKLGDQEDENAPLRFRLKRLFPYADSVLLLRRTDILLPFISRQPNQ